MVRLSCCETGILLIVDAVLYSSLTRFKLGNDAQSLWPGTSKCDAGCFALPACAAECEELVCLNFAVLQRHWDINRYLQNYWMKAKKVYVLHITCTLVMVKCRKKLLLMSLSMVVGAIKNKLWKTIKLEAINYFCTRCLFCKCFS